MFSIYQPYDGEKMRHFGQKNLRFYVKYSLKVFYISYF